MASQITPVLNSSAFRLDLSSIKKEASNSTEFRVQLVSQSSIDSYRMAEHPCIERAARAQSRPETAELAELFCKCGKELATPNRSGESPSFFQEGVLQTPLRRREAQDPLKAEMSDNEDTLLSDIYSRVILKDEAFFKNKVIPDHHADPEIQHIFDLCRQIQSKGMDPEILDKLREMTKKFSRKFE